MLAGLIFATEDADDRVGVLAATLPFGGLTLIEFQARLLVAAGATHIILVVARMTPELLGAISRIGRRGVSVDAVRSAGEVLEKLHPLARVLVVADGVVTTSEVVQAIAAAPHDTLLVTDQMDSHYERVGANVAWAGLALLDCKRIAEVAALPRDYDFQSTLLRVAAQAAADQVRLDAHMAPGHTIERSTQALAARGNGTVAALVARPARWAERYLLSPLIRLILPPLMTRGVGTITVLAGGIAVALGAWLTIFIGHPAVGMALTYLAVGVTGVAAALAWVRDEGSVARIAEHLTPAIVAGAALLVGYGADRPAGLILATTLIIIAALLERVAGSAHARRLWASPVAYPLLMLPLLALGQPLFALGLAALYAVVTLAVAIEGFLEKP
ncbi:hypothetical protein [Sphingomonas echinoides]|uniref:Glycosyltransferase n=1 Tax=Sphingomonas echinoides TaxID=59803 RepID=A0ABU4PQQ4_9SPHN|nr:hypothetical protein [Sphingomonas echinoides]MDX5985448.1 hypothetical protein [Sphingomonas echinoides]